MPAVLYTCQRNRTANPAKSPMTIIPMLNIPFKSIAVYLGGPLLRSRKGYKYLLTYARPLVYLEAIPLKTLEAFDH